MFRARTSVWCAVLAAFAGATIPTGGQPASAQAVGTAPADDRGRVLQYVRTGGAAVSLAARAALAGSDADIQSFLSEELAPAREQDDLARIALLVSLDGPTVNAEAQRAVEGGSQEVRAFLEQDWSLAWAHDERIRVGRIAEGGGPTDDTHDWRDQFGKTYDAVGDTSRATAEQQNLEQIKKSVRNHLLKGNDYTVVDMTGYPMEWRIEIAKVLEGTSSEVVRIGF